MSTLMYSPAVQIRIRTASHGIVDVSDDISDGRLSLRQNQPHSLQFSLLNPGRKYDRIFTPNDRIVVRLKRLTWTQNFSGYLGRVPYFSAFPGSITLNALCTAKRLMYTYWDPGYQETVNFLNALTMQSTGQSDSGLGQKTVAVLSEVANWPGDKVHIGRLPEDWVQIMDQLVASLGPAFAVPDSLVNGGPTTGPLIAGSSLLDNGTIELKKADGSIDQGEGYGHFKSTSGPIKPYRLIDNSSLALDPTLGGNIKFDKPAMAGVGLALNETRANPLDEWYCALDLPWADVTSPSRQEEARRWWAGRKVLVVNEAKNTSVVLRLVDFKRGAALWTSQRALDTIGAKDGDPVSWRFAEQLAPAGSTGINRGADGYDANTDQPIGLTGGPEATTNGPTINAHSGLNFTSADGLKGNVRAARDFALANWPGIKSISGLRVGAIVAGTSTPSDHGKGLAIDFVVSSGDAQGAERALGNSIAMWFAANAAVFGVKGIIWYRRINNGQGWRPYVTKGADSANNNHTNHVHISFYDTGQTAAGAPGTPWVGSTPSDFEGGFDPNGSPTVGSPVLTQAYNWITEGNPESNILFGVRRLMNDEPLLPMIETLVRTSQRMWCTAPNGDFIAWFPDYFGHYGLASTMQIKPIELIDLTMAWDDSRLKTHFFTAGSQTGYGSPSMEQEVATRRFQTTGIASVEFPEILEALLNVNREDPASAGWVDPQAILQRFGARPEFRPMGTLSVDGRAEFWYALNLFRENWANQFSCQASLTFMPEMWPGTLMQLPDYGIQFYVEGVDHSFDFGEGGGFETSVTITSPSALDGSGFYGLPRGGRQDPLGVAPPEPGAPSQPNGVLFSSQGSTVYQNGDGAVTP